MRRSLLSLLHVFYFVTKAAYTTGATADDTGAAPVSAGAPGSESCAALSAQLWAAPTELISQLESEMRAQTPQGAMPAGSLVVQVLVAIVAVHIVIDVPQRTLL